MNYYTILSKLFFVFFLGVIFIFMTAFTFPQPLDIKRQLSEKWQVLLSKTRGAKELQQWRGTYIETKQVIQEAYDAGARELAAEKMQEAEDVLNKSIDCAKQRDYKKAVAFAIKAKEAAKSALSDATSIKAEKEKELQKVVLELEKYVQGMDKSNILNKQNEAVLYLSDIRHAMILEEFDDAATAVEIFKKNFMY
jgi:hypothetical protein